MSRRKMRWNKPNFLIWETLLPIEKTLYETHLKFAKSHLYQLHDGSWRRAVRLHSVFTDVFKQEIKPWKGQNSVNSEETLPTKNRVQRSKLDLLKLHVVVFDRMID